MKAEIELEPFRTPNYVLTKAKVGRRQDGFENVPKFHISELSDETLNELCDQFRKEIFEKKAKGRVEDGKR